MKPLKLDIKAFGPYPDEAHVDFTELSKSGLFLICGKTGSGKTALLDAMMFALYGSSSGDNRNKFEALRSNLADDKTETLVSFEFSVRGEQYRFVRRLEKKRVNLHFSCGAFKRDEAGEWQPLFENPRVNDVNAKAKELIGLDEDQFRKVIILPQGKFERLLVSETEEKEEILDEIFPVGKWEEIAERLKNKMQERYDALKGKKDEVDRELLKLNCQSTDELSEKIEASEKALAEKIAEYEAKEYDKKQEKLQEEFTAAKKFADDMTALSEAEKALAKEKTRESGCNETKNKVALAKRARNLQNELERLDEKKDLLKKREKNLNDFTTAREKAEGDAKKAEDAAKELLREEKEIDKAKEERTKCEQSKGAYEKLAECEKEIADQNEKVAKLNRTFEEKKSAHENAIIALQRIESERRKLSERYERLNKAYLDNIAGELASELKDGAPCPVCGSTAHPSKAQRSEESVSRADVDEAKEKRDEKDREKENADNKRTSAETDEKNAKNVLDDESKKLVELEAAKKAASASLIEGIESKEALERKIAALTKAIAGYEARKTKVEEAQKSATLALENAKTNLKNATDELDGAKEAYIKASEAVKEALTRESFASEEEAFAAVKNVAKIDAWEKVINDYENTVRELNRDVERLKGETANKKLRTLGEIKKEQDDIQLAIKAFIADKTSRKNKITELKEKAKLFAKDMESYNENIKEAEDDLKFSKKLKGETGIGLKRYVLGIMFSQVVAAANELLVKIHGGRYRLYRSDEASGTSKKKGLELAVTDFYGGDKKARFVNTLSGGEKFLVSLSLALGLSAVARSGGISVEALFIDEGFGSLDEDSINEALDILKTVRGANGIVGIISHVELLRENIPTKLLVEKSAKGSSLKTVIG